ncbi:PrmA Ribosomal protein L11 methylase [Acidimicrobiia bacterium]
MTEWMSIVVVVDPVEVDLVSGLVWDLGVSGIEEQPLPDGAVELRIGCERTIAQQALEVLAERWAPTAEPVAADEGLDAWRDHAQVWRIGSILIVPPWLETPTDVAESDLVLVIDPGHAFGSASHETTRMCLEAVVELVTPGCAVADIGCGSGVLAIAAARRGATTVVATDIAADAIVATLDNALTNNVADLVEVSTATIDELDPTRFDVVFANIGAATLSSMAAALVQVTKPEGVLVLSGLLGEQVETVIESFEQTGALRTEVRADGEWRTVLLKRSR